MNDSKPSDDQHPPGEPGQPYSVQSTSSLLSNVSKRPIYCPNSDCKKLIGITRLLSHFAFDHPKIPKQSVMFNQPATLEVSLNSMEYETSCCIALFIITDDHEHPKGFLEPAVTFPLFAAKLHVQFPGSQARGAEAADAEGTYAGDAYAEGTYAGDAYADGTYAGEAYAKATYAEAAYTEAASAEAAYTKAAGAEAAYATAAGAGAAYAEVASDDADLVLLWVCGNTDYNHQCLLELTDNRHTAIHSYYGVVNSVRAENDPVSVYRRGDCLLTQMATINQLTNCGNFSMEMKLLVTD